MHRSITRIILTILCGLAALPWTPGTTSAAPGSAVVVDPTSHQVIWPPDFYSQNPPPNQTFGTTAGTSVQGNDSRIGYIYTPEMCGALGDGVHDDTSAVQQAITSAQGYGVVRFGNKTYRITAPLSVTAPVSLVGSAAWTSYGQVSANVEAVNVPVLPPYLRGSVIVQATAGANIINVTGSGLTVNIRDLGLTFDPAIRFQNTGDGISCLPPVMHTFYRDSGLMASTWERVTVFGHDGNHYAYNLTNPLNCRLADLSAFGGGGVRVDTNGQAAYNNYLGNVVFDAPYMVTMLPGSAHAYQIDATNGETILLVFIRPQAWVKDVRASGLVSVLPNGSQRTFNVVTPSSENPFSGGSSWLTIIAPDLETTVPGVTYHIPDAPGIFLGPGLLNDFSNTAQNSTVEDVRVGTLKIRNGVMQLRAGTPVDDFTGAGLETSYAPTGFVSATSATYLGGSGMAVLLPYDRTAGAFRDLWLRANTLRMDAAGKLALCLSPLQYLFGVTDSSVSTPATIGFAPLSSGQATRLAVAGDVVSLQAAHGGRLTMQSYWGIDVYGDRQQGTALAPAANGGDGNDYSMWVHGAFRADACVIPVGDPHVNGSIYWDTTTNTVKRSNG